MHINQIPFYYKALFIDWLLKSRVRLLSQMHYGPSENNIFDLLRYHKTSEQTVYIYTPTVWHTDRELLGNSGSGSFLSYVVFL